MPKIVDADEKRRLIARAACQAIADKGVGRVTMVDIARSAGVTTGMIANYFENKNAIIVAALRIPFENIEVRMEARIARGEDDLAELLEVAIPVSKSHVADVAAWVSFWGLIATNRDFRRMNNHLHREGQAIYARAMHAAWPEAPAWPADIHEQALRSITTFLFGLSAGGVTNPRAWTRKVQRDQLRRHLLLIRAWARDASRGKTGIS